MPERMPAFLCINTTKSFDTVYGVCVYKFCNCVCRVRKFHTSQYPQTTKLYSYRISRTKKLFSRYTINGLKCANNDGENTNSDHKQQLHSTTSYRSKCVVHRRRQSKQAAAENTFVYLGVQRRATLCVCVNVCLSSEEEDDDDASHYICYKHKIIINYNCVS